MAKGNQLHRLVMIVNRLAHPGRYMMPERLTEYVEYQMRSRYSDNAGISLRTLQRDFHTIEELFGIKIRYRKDYGYYIAEYGRDNDGYEELLLNFEILSSIDKDSVMKQYVLPVPTTDSAIAKAVEPLSDMKEVEKNLMQGLFVSVIDLPMKKNLSAKGLYCMKLREGVVLPKGYQCKNDLFYIDIATVSLEKRLWNQELHAKGHGTFFRSVGAMLGYRPQKGRLCGKSNKRNYTFPSQDEQQIVKWLERSILVNCMKCVGDLDDLETALIKKYKPLMNIFKNPEASEQLKRHRKECQDIANGK